MFVLGYGLHLADLYRNVPRVVEADRDVRRARPRRLRRRALRRRDQARRAANEARCYGGPRTDPEAPVIPMSLVGVRVEVPSNQPIVLLRENDGQRYLPIFIGPPEATAIVYALQGMETPRPDDPRPLQDGARRPRRQARCRSSSPSSTTAPSTPRSSSPATAAPTGISSRPSDAIALAVRYARAGADLRQRGRARGGRGALRAGRGRAEQIEQFREFLDQVRPEDFAHGPNSPPSELVDR